MAALLLLGLLLAACRTPTPEPPGVRQVAAFPDSGRALFPSWSPDGRTIVLVTGDLAHNGFLHLVDVDSGEAMRVGEWGVHEEPRWSPDGSLLAYSDCAEVVVLSPPGDRPVARLPGCGGDWSPDGRSLAVFAPGADVAIQVLTLDGQAAREVFRQASPGRLLGGIAWSRASDRIAFAYGHVPPAVLNEDVYVVNPDGTGLRLVAASPADEYDPSWSPDGEWLAFLWEENDPPFGERVMLAKWDGSCAMAVFTADALTGVDWAPSGQELAITQSDRLLVLDLASLLGPQFPDLEAVCRGG